MSIAQEIKNVNIAARKVHGDDISLLVARCVAFGNDDNLVLVMGKNQKSAALDFAKTVKGSKVKEEKSIDGKTYSSVSF